MTTKNNEMQTVQLVGTISSTSDKAGKFDTNRKSIYFNLLDDEEVKKATDFGCKVYTSEEDGTDFAIIKASENIKCYNRDGKVIDIKSGIRGTENSPVPNFHSDGNIVAVSVIKGENMGSKYTRVYAVLGELHEFEGESPFTDITDKLDF